MVAIVKDPANPTFDNVPKALTPQVIRKYFPSCVACPFGNLSARPLPRKSTSKASIGEEWEVDIKGPWTDADGRMIKSFSGCRYSFVAIDRHSREVIAFLVRSRSNLVRH